MLKVGITGGIGAGKSLVTKIFAALNIPVFYADLEAALIIRRNEQVKQQLKQRFGNSVYNESGMLNKELFANLIFNNADNRQKINSLIHPLVHEEFNTWFSRQTSPYVLYEAALIFESGNNKNLDYVITVFASENIRIKRVLERDNRSEDQIRNIIAQQMNEDEKLKLADAIVFNDESQLLIPQILKLHQQLLLKSKAN